MKLGIPDTSTLLRDIKGAPAASFTGCCMRGDMIISANDPRADRAYGPCGCTYYRDGESIVLVHKTDCHYYGVTPETISPRAS